MPENPLPKSMYTPNTIITIPESWEKKVICSFKRLPMNVALMPRRINTILKPAKKEMLIPIIFFLEDCREYATNAGKIGKVQGDTNESRPAINAIMRSKGSALPAASRPTVENSKPWVERSRELSQKFCCFSSSMV